MCVLERRGHFGVQRASVGQNDAKVSRTSSKSSKIAHTNSPNDLCDVETVSLRANRMEIFEHDAMHAVNMRCNEYRVKSLQSASGIPVSGVANAEGPR